MGGVNEHERGRTDKREHSNVEFCTALFVHFKNALENSFTQKEIFTSDKTCKKFTLN